jgi:hypothetical protein
MHFSATTFQCNYEIVLLCRRSVRTTFFSAQISGLNVLVLLRLPSESAGLPLRQQAAIPFSLWFRVLASQVINCPRSFPGSDVCGHESWIGDIRVDLLKKNPPLPLSGPGAHMRLRCLTH